MPYRYRGTGVVIERKRSFLQAENQIAVGRNNETVYC